VTDDDISSEFSAEIISQLTSPYQWPPQLTPSHQAPSSTSPALTHQAHRSIPTTFSTLFPTTHSSSPSEYSTDPTDIPADPLPQSRDHALHDHALHDHALQRAIDLSFAEANPDPPPVKKRAKAPKAKAPKAKAPKAKAPRAKRQKTQHTECSICLTGITRATLVVTQCAHTYHAKCLDTWHRVRRNAGKQPNCPYCNTLL